MLKQTILCLAVFSLGGCAAIQIPADRLSRNEAAMRGAEELGAVKVPAARLHLEMAKDQTAAAKRLAADGDGRALLMLARAESDAELALSLARESAVHADATRAAEDLKAVQARGGP